MIVTCGEAVVDFLPETDPDGHPLFRPVLGGSLYNVALGLGRLGVPASYFWELSTDPFGTWFARELEAAGVHLGALVRGTRPTPLAFVDLSGPEPHFQIVDAGAIMSSFDPAVAGSLPEGARVLHTGSAILALEPGGAAIEAFARAASEGVAISLDFNVRPPSVSDREAYRARLDRLVNVATIVKASAADLAFLEPDTPPEAFLDRWQAAGVSLAIVTMAERGVLAAAGDHRVRHPAVKLDLRDPVGAGDAFTTGMLARLWELDRLARQTLATIGEDELSAALGHAQEVAAYVCRRPGAVFPWKADLAAERRRVGSALIA